MRERLREKEKERERERKKERKEKGRCGTVEKVCQTGLLNTIATSETPT